MRPDRMKQMMAHLTRPGMAQGGRIGFNKGSGPDKGGDATRLKTLKADYVKFGKNKLDKGAQVLGFKNYADMEGPTNANFRRAIRRQLIKYGEVLPPGFESDKRGRKTRIPKEQEIQIKLLKETNNKKFFNPKQFAKDNNISLAKVKQQAKRLQTNIYKKRMLEAGKDVGVTLEWIPKDPKFSDNALNKLWKSKLIKYEREKIDELFYDAFGRENIKGTNKPNSSYEPKKFLAIKKNLNEYRQLRNAINAKYPNINFELDHPLSKSSLNKLFNATTEQLTRVNPLDKDLNRGFKDALSQQYEKAVQGNNLNKKKAVEKIARDLKLNIGKISDDATNFKYGVKEFQKLNIKDEIGKSLKNLQFLNKNFQDYVKKNPELFKTAGIKTQQIFTRVTPSQIKGVENLLLKLAGQIDKDCAQAVADGGRIGLQAIGSTSVCITKAKNYMSEQLEKGIGTQQNAKTSLIKRIISGTGQFIKQGLNPSELFKLENLVGKPALYAMAAIESGLLADDVLRKKEPINVAAAENFLFGNLLNLDADAERAKNIINDPNLSPAAKTYAQGIIDQDNFTKLSQTYATNLVKNPLFIPSGAKAKADTALANLKNKITNIPETGRMDYESLLADKQDAFTAKEKRFDAPDKPGLPSFTSGQLEKRNVPGEFVIDPSFPLPLQRETLVPSYVSPSYSPERSKFETDEFINKYLKSIGEEPLRSGEGTLIRMNMPQQLGLFGTQERFARGGLSGGDKSGPPPESGPNSQGLPSLLKRVRNL